MARGLGAPPLTGLDPTAKAPYGWAPMIVLFVVGLVDRIEHNLLSGVLPIIQKEWGFSDTAAGSIPAAAAIAAGLVAIPAGYFADRYSRTRIIAVVVALWAVATLGSGLATGFAMFYVMRVFLSAAETIDNPAASSLLADYYPPKTRALAFGWNRVTNNLGAVGTILGGVLGAAFGWRNAFLIMVIPGLLTAVLVWFLREPERGHTDRMVAGAAEASPEEPRVPFGRQLKEVLGIPTLIIASIGSALLGMGLTGAAYWLPSLMVRAFRMEPGPAATRAGLISLVAVILGTLVGAWLGRRWHGTVRGGRLLAGGGGVASGSVVIMIALWTLDSFALFAALLVIGVALLAVAIPNLYASIADVVGASGRGLGFGFLQVLSTVGGAIGPLAVGIVSDQTGSLVTGMIVLTVPMVISGLVTLSARSSYERDAQKVLDAARGSIPG